MKNPGGYQLIDFGGVEISTEQATIVENKEIASRLRETNKTIFIDGLKFGAATVSVIIMAKSDTGANDGKVYSFIGPNDKYFTISTDDENITFTPV